MVHASIAPEESGAILTCRGLTRRFPSGNQVLTVLSDVDLSIRRGEFVALMGPSGSGKSTLLGLLAGLDRPSAGTVRLAGAALERLDEDALAELRRVRVGFVFQDFRLIASLTARENVLVPLELGRIPDAAKKCDAMLARVGLAARAHHRPAQLSGGEQQRVALARAFAKRPEVLLADEPTGNLDARTGESVLALLLALRAEAGSTLVVVTHDPAVAARADRTLRMEAGRLVDAGNAQP
ncbi:MAG: ABC transporter ATP-binding protein [Polyangiales bacterium]